MKVGDLVQWHSPEGTFLAEIAAFWNKRDIDYDCPESVAIIPMVRVIVLTGEDAGKSLTIRRSIFSKKFLMVNQAS